MSALFEACDAPAPAGAPLAASRTVARGSQWVTLHPRHFASTSAPSCNVRVRWSLHGPESAPWVVVQGGISADREVAADASAGAPGWWSGIVGPGLAIDTRRVRVLAIDWLERADLGNARAIDSRDQADAIAALLDAFEVRCVRAFVGASYGAMVGLAFAALHPCRLARLVAISGAHRAHPLSTALRNLQRGIVRLATDAGDARAGLDLARRLAMTTYRSEREFAERCGGEPAFSGGRYRFAEEDWLAAVGARFAERFDPERFLSLSESIDLHRVDPGEVRVPTTLVGIPGDRVVPLADLCEVQRACGAPATLHVIDSRYGHDAFLKEPIAIGNLLRETLEPIGA